MLAYALRLPSVAQQVHQNEPRAKPTLLKPKAYTPQPSTPESEKGEKYYSQANCSACHAINDEGGTAGPMLDGIGQRRQTDFLYARLADTPGALKTYAKLTGQNMQNLTPHVRLSADISHCLVAFLLTLPEPPGGFAVFGHDAEISKEPNLAVDFQPAEKTAASEEGKKLYEKFGCAQCHQIQQAGGFVGTSLDGVGGRHSRDYIAAHITNAQAHAVKTDKFFELVPTSMPAINATPAQIQRITDYLMTLPGN